MKVRYTTDRVRYRSLSQEELRAAFLVEDLFRPGQLALHYCEEDRAIVGSATPMDGPLKLTGGKQLASASFLERRELGILNIGGAGTVEVDGQSHRLDRLDGLYVGKGAREVSFRSAQASSPARFYLLSYPAHAAYPTTLVRQSEAASVELGSLTEANHRVLRKYIHPEGVKSCQLVMGVTELREGSVWNSMPPHTHERRSEIYLYFDVPPEAMVFHFMGTPEETKHLVLREGEAVVSPMWSMHCGVGTRAYRFCWGMGGENQIFSDMDPVAVQSLK